MDFRYDFYEDELEIFDSKDIAIEGEDRTLHVSMKPDEIKALRDYLDTELERYQATRSRPEEPEPIEDGFYVTQDGILIHRDSANQPCEYTVYTDSPTYYSDWRLVYADLKPSAFPLTHVTVEDFRKLVKK
ncbi:hypothetical protein [Bifidobacterium moukalabense]|uniref:hypothetical protein n=1 Tax=Bifidobacterium moukalabense TaxID=1333651 RepID=UPI0010F864E5|nr:hypothetical protein [Bifidobacterium moukalabense]